MNQTFSIEGMHCSACVARVTKALSPFADKVEVTLNPPQAVLIGLHADARFEALQGAVEDAGKYVITKAGETKAMQPDSLQNAGIGHLSSGGKYAKFKWPILIIVSLAVVLILVRLLN